MFQGMLAAGTPNAGGGIFSLIVPLVLMVAIFYFLMIRPQNKSKNNVMQC